MRIRKPTIPFHRLYTKQWEVNSPVSVLYKMAYIAETGLIPGGIESQDILITIMDGKFFVREGTHGILGLIYLGHDSILPHEYHLVLDEESQDFIRRKMSEYPELQSPQTMASLARAFGSLIIETALHWDGLETLGGNTQLL